MKSLGSTSTGVSSFACHCLTVGLELEGLATFDSPTSLCRAPDGFEEVGFVSAVLGPGTLVWVDGGSGVLVSDGLLPADLPPADLPPAGVLSASLPPVALPPAGLPSMVVPSPCSSPVTFPPEVFPPGAFPPVGLALTAGTWSKNALELRPPASQLAKKLV